MARFAPDVEVAVALIERLDMDDWPRRTEGLSHSQPYMIFGDFEELHDVQAWLATRAGDAPSLVQAAVANFRRVLDDLLLVFEYDLDPRDQSFWMRKWYHPGLGGTGSPHEVVRYELHVLLVRNLVAELTRAINLVLERARRADERVLLGVALATVDTGALNAPMQAARYSDVEESEPQPYPGLRGFPDVIDTRDLGALGEAYEGVARKPADFVAWIDELMKRLQAHPSKEPPTTTFPLPLSLPRPAQEQDDGSNEPGRQVGFTDSRVLAPYGVLLAMSTIGGTTSTPWLLGASLAAVIASVPLHRGLWRAPPRRSALALIVFAAVLGGLVGYAVASPEGRKVVHRGTDRTKARPPVAYDGGVGQLESGDIFRGQSSSGRFADPTRVVAGRQVRMLFRLSNVGPDSLTGVRFRVRLPSAAAHSLAIEGLASATNSHPRQVNDTVTVVFRQGAGCLRYVSRSAVLLDSHRGVLENLDVTVTGPGIDAGSLGVSLSDVRYVMLRARALAGAPGHSCHGSAASTPN